MHFMIRKVNLMERVLTIIQMGEFTLEIFTKVFLMARAVLFAQQGNGIKDR